MDFDALVEWVHGAVQRLGERFGPRELTHIRTLFGILAEHGEPSTTHWLDWHRLAVKCAKRLDDEPPAAPSPAMLDAAKRKRKGKGKAGVRSRSAVAKKPRSVQAPAQRVRKQTAPAFEVSAEFERALAVVNGGAPLLFVTGRAGTGKSTFIRYLERELAERSIVVVAPTGIAALNAGGQTIHSFFRLPPRLLAASDVRLLDDPAAIEKLEVLVIDEISMVRADLLDAVDVSLRLHRKTETPFGGVQLVLIGDLFQLPPVVPRGPEGDAIAARYATPFFFGAAALRGLQATVVELTRVHRQEDPEFIEILGALRSGRGIAPAVEALNRACSGRLPAGPHLMLVTRNDAADRENGQRLEALPGQPRSYLATLEGDFPDDRLPAPRTLKLKKDAQVMFTRNDPERRWVNGTTGIVESLNATAIRVRLQNGTTHDVESETWENNRYSFDRRENQVIAESVGSFRQFPLMPAWAVTIHKAQGLTLDRAHVDFGSGAFAEGQAYVALSRCRRMGDLTLARPLRVSDIRCSGAIRTFHRALKRSMSTGPGRIVVWDVRESADMREVAAAILEHDADVAVLAVIRPEDGLREELTRAGFEHVVAHGSLLVASRVELMMTGSPQFDDEALLSVDVGGVTVIAALLPQGEAKRPLWHALHEIPLDRPLLLAGNLNTGAHFADEEGGTMICAEEFARLTLLGWSDLWRRTHGDAREFTWLSPRERAFRIDHAFASPALVERVAACSYSHHEREAGIATHSMLIVDFE